MLLLDDIAGTSLIAGMAWSRAPETRELMRERMANPDSDFGWRKGKVICSGLRPDGWMDTHRRNGVMAEHGLVDAAPLRHPDDPLDWHEMPPTPDRFSTTYHKNHAWDNRFEPDAEDALVLTDDLNPVDIWAERINREARLGLHGYFDYGLSW